MPAIDVDGVTHLTFDCYGTIIDWETGISDAIIYYTDISGISASDRMTPTTLVDPLTLNGWYEVTIPFQVWKGVVSFSIWAIDTNDNDNQTGFYDMFVQLPPFYVWGDVTSDDGPVSSGIVLVTNTITNETVITLTGGDGSYMVNLANLYSGYMHEELLEIFATDGLYYDYNYTAVDMLSDEDPTLGWPNIRADIYLSQIPEFTTLLVPISMTLLLFFVIRRKRSRREEDE